MESHITQFFPLTRNFLIAVPLVWFFINLLNELLYWKGSVNSDFHVDDVITSLFAALIIIGLGFLFQSTICI